MFLRNVTVQLTSDMVSHPEKHNRNNRAKIQDIRNKN